MAEKKVSDRIRELIHTQLAGTWCVVLGQLLSYDKERARAKVKPILKLPLTEKGKAEEFPDVFEVPIEIGLSGPFYHRLPYKTGNAGDVVIMVVHDRALDELIQTRKRTDPKLGRVHSLDDAIVIGSIRVNRDYLLPNRNLMDLVLGENWTTATRVYLTPEGEIVLQAPKERQIKLGVDAKDRICLENLAQDFYNHIHVGDSGGLTSPPTNRRPWQTEYVSNLAVARKFPLNDYVPLQRGSVKHQPIVLDWKGLWDAIKKFVEEACKAITAADAFVNDPVGTVGEGIKAALGVKGADINKAAVTADSGSGDGAGPGSGSGSDQGSDPATEAIRSDYGDSEKANVEAESNAQTPADKLMQDVSSYFDGLKGDLERSLQSRAQQWLGTLGLDPKSLSAIKDVAAQAPVSDFTSIVKGKGYQVLKGWAEQAGISNPEVP